MLATSTTEESQFNRRAERWEQLATELDQQKGWTQELFPHAAAGQRHQKGATRPPDLSPPAPWSGGLLFFNDRDSRPSRRGVTQAKLSTD
jgi:hypothetical protein